MSRVSIRVSTNRDGERAMLRASRVAPLSDRAVRRSFFELGDHLKRETSRDILDRASKRGRVYLISDRRGRRRRHRSSAPGQTHANLTGRLRRSLSWKVRGARSMDFGYGVSTTKRNAAPEYDEHVEFGTGRMAARPSIGNNVERHGSRRVEVDFGDALGRFMTRGGG